MVNAHGPPFGFGLDMIPFSRLMVEGNDESVPQSPSRRARWWYIHQFEVFKRAKILQFSNGEGKKDSIIENSLLKQTRPTKTLSHNSIADDWGITLCVKFWQIPFGSERNDGQGAIKLLRVFLCNSSSFIEDETLFFICQSSPTRVAF